MGFSERLRRGVLGIQLNLPSVVENTGEDEARIQFVTSAIRAAWWIYFFPNVHLDLSDAGWSTLRRDVARQARHLFEETFRAPQLAAERDSHVSPRTSDATWSPLIEMERTRVDGSPALFVLHRMLYEPGHESLLGHLLVPLLGGLYEIRWGTADRTTGYRESTQMVKRLSGLGPGELPEHPGQEVFDDPALDTVFPDHPVSVARAARRWIQANLAIRVLEPGRYVAGCEVELASLDCALVPPPRFVLAHTTRSDGGREARFDRASLAGSDGVDQFVVWTPDRGGGLERLEGKRFETAVEKLARDLYASAEVNGIRTMLVAHSPKTAARVIVEGDGHQGPLRMAVHGLRIAGSVFVLCLMTTATLEGEEMVDEVDRSAASLRLLTA